VAYQIISRHKPSGDNINIT